MYTEDLLQAQLEARQAGRDFAVATIAEALGSTPRTNGKMIVYADGTTSWVPLAAVRRSCR